MYRLVSNREIELAQHSMQSLKAAVSNTSQSHFGSAAREKIRVLSSHMNAASIAIDVLRSDIHNPQAKALVQQYEILERSARDIVEDLSKSVDYKGPCRSTMSATDKSKYISEHGAEKFFSLPR